MKTFLHKPWQGLAPLLCLLSWATASNAGTDLNIASLRQEKWGDQTNGLVAGVLVSGAGDRQRSPDVSVILRQAATRQDKHDLYFGLINIPNPGNTSAPGTTPRYYMATNGFCGPIELRDSAKQLVQLRNPSLAAALAYPGYYSLQAMEGALMGHHSLYSGPSLPTPLMTSLPQLAKFHVEDEFLVSGPGEYELTVWPKVYKRVSPTNDVCQRIDLPPVSVTVNLP